MAGTGSSKRPYRAVGTPASTNSAFIHAFDRSSHAPSAPGPNTNRPLARNRSASPSTSGASGPMTKRSASISSGGAGVDPGIPMLPGVTTTSAVRASARARACSRPPLPTTQTFTTADPQPRRPIPAAEGGHPGRRARASQCGGRAAPPFGRSAFDSPERSERSEASERETSEADELVAAGADTDETDRDASLLAQERDVVLGRSRHVMQLGRGRQVGLPTG